MRCDRKTMLLYAVTDRAWTGEKSLYEQVELSLKGGATCIQLREKSLDESGFLREATEINALCKRYNVPFIVNDNVEIAVRCGADGVHVGQEDMKALDVRNRIGRNMILGVSAHTVGEALAAVENGADYIGAGAVFSTSTKLDVSLMPKEVLKDICSAVSVPVVAIGGIGKNNIHQLSGSGVDGVALVSAIFAAENITQECRELKALSAKTVSDSMGRVLTVAGSDSSGGAGIQADIKTITAHKMYAMSVITALTAQNTTGVYGIMDVTPDFVGKQLDCIFTDIIPHSVKIGMVSRGEIIEIIAEKLREYKAQNIVIDPVMVSTSGSKLISDEAKAVLVEKLLPLGAVITPNIAEATVLSGIDIKTEEEMVKAAKEIYENYGAAVLVKGGHLGDEATDILYNKGKISLFKSRRVENKNTHGTGCTLSSAIACNLAAGYGLESSIKNAKSYLTGALESMLDLGKGSGPLNHMYNTNTL